MSSVVLGEVVDGHNDEEQLDWHNRSILLSLYALLYVYTLNYNFNLAGCWYTDDYAFSATASVSRMLIFAADKSVK